MPGAIANRQQKSGESRKTVQSPDLIINQLKDR